MGTGVELQSIPDDAATQAFVSTLRGGAIQQGDTHYDVARKVYNAMIDRKPRLVTVGRAQPGRQDVNAEEVHGSSTWKLSKSTFGELPVAPPMKMPWLVADTNAGET